MDRHNTQGLTRASLLIVTMLLLISGPAPTLNGQAFSIVPLGFTDAEHTRNDGVHTSGARFLNELGYVAGSSRRYNGAATTMDFTMWVYDGVTTTKVGLFDSSHLYRTRIVAMNDSGHAVGVTGRAGTGPYSESVWYFDGVTTFNIGYDDAEHVSITGFRDSSISTDELTNSGLAIGTSVRFNSGSVNLGLTSWVYDNQTGTRSKTGITDSLHTRNDGYRYSWNESINSAGQILGNSMLFNGQTSQVGQSAWIYENGTRTLIGLTDAEHTNASGFQFNSGESRNPNLNNSGQAIGNSRRYSWTGSNIGQSAWRYSQGTTTKIGLVDSEHTNATSGRQYSEAVAINENGMVAGDSERSGASGAGQSAWRFDGTTTTKIGLIDAEHTRDNGSQNNSVNRINNAGDVIGKAQRFNGGALAGWSVWFSDGASTQKVGLLDGIHIRSDGWKESSPSGITDSGIVWGESVRYEGLTEIGYTTWVYDSNTDETYSIVLSERVTDNFTHAVIGYMDDDGTAYGGYDLFDSMTGALIGNRAFVFTFADGARDFADVYGTEISASGWEYLSGVATRNNAGMMIGYGSYGYDSLNSLAFITVPSSVPEPSSFVTFFVAIAGVLTRRKSRLKKGQNSISHI